MSMAFRHYRTHIMNNKSGKKTTTSAKAASHLAPVSTPEPVVGVSGETNTSFIVQNQLGSPLHISDIRLAFAPHEAKDLTWEMSEWTHQSQDLRKAIRKGLLRRITPEEFEFALEENEEAEYNEMVEEQIRQDRLNSLEGDNDDVIADSEDIMRKSRNTTSVVISGSSDPVNYANAFEVLRETYEDEGRRLSSRQFQKMTEDDPTLVDRLLRTGSVVTSGVAGRGRATYATPPSNEGARMGHRSTRMSNYGRDNFLAGAQDDVTFAAPVRTSRNAPARSTPQMPLGEEIDLLSDNS